MAQVASRIGAHRSETDLLADASRGPLPDEVKQGALA